MSSRIAVYVRVSTVDQKTELQKQEIEAYLKAVGYTEYTLFEDHGISGRHTRRPKFQEMLSLVRQRKFDTVVVWKLDRLARSIRDLVHVIDDFAELKIKFISIREGIDLTTAAGRMLAHIIGIIADFEAEMINERVRSGIAAARKRGVRFGRPKVYWDDDKIQALRAQGLSYRDIAHRLGVSLGHVQKALKRTVA